MKRYDIDRLDNRDPEVIRQMIRWLEPPLWAYFRPVVRGLERIPSGAGLYVGNHNAALLSPDSFIFAIAAYHAYGMGAVPYGLGHEFAISFPVFHQILMPLGAVRASHEMAGRLFREGHKVLVYPGGDLDAMRPFRARHRVVFGPRRGYLQLAIRRGVPIIPVVTAGAQSTFIVLNEGKGTAKLLGLDRLFRIKVWPWTLSLPWGLTFGPPPPHFPLPTRIFIEVLEPISFDRTGDVAAEDPYYVERCHSRVHGAMQTALERLASDRRSARRAAGDRPS